MSLCTGRALDVLQGSVIQYFTGYFSTVPSVVYVIILDVSCSTIFSTLPPFNVSLVFSYVIFTNHFTSAFLYCVAFCNPCYVAARLCQSIDYL